MKRSIVIATPHFESAMVIGRAAEDAKYSRVWLTETTGRDAIVRAAALGTVTSRIGIATGIAYAFARGPLAMAAAAAEAQQACDGRFTLGLGAGTRGIRRRYGVTDWERAAPQFADYARLLRKLLDADGGDVDHKGEFYQLRAPSYPSPAS